MSVVVTFAQIFNTVKKEKSTKLVQNNNAKLVEDCSTYTQF